MSHELNFCYLRGCIRIVFSCNREIFWFLFWVFIPFTVWFHLETGQIHFLRYWILAAAAWVCFPLPVDGQIRFPRLVFSFLLNLLSARISARSLGTHFDFCPAVSRVPAWFSRPGLDADATGRIRFPRAQIFRRRIFPSRPCRSRFCRRVNFIFPWASPRFVLGCQSAVGRRTSRSVFPCRSASAALGLSPLRFSQVQARHRFSPRPLQFSIFLCLSVPVVSCSGSIGVVPRRVGQSPASNFWSFCSVIIRARFSFQVLVRILVLVGGSRFYFWAIEFKTLSFS
jgi:hypothetical protein